MGSVEWTARQRTAWSMRWRTGEKVSSIRMYSAGRLENVSLRYLAKMMSSVPFVVRAECCKIHSVDVVAHLFFQGIAGEVAVFL